MYERWETDDMAATPDSGASASQKATSAVGMRVQAHTSPTKDRAPSEAAHGPSGNQELPFSHTCFL